MQVVATYKFVILEKFTSIILEVDGNNYKISPSYIFYDYSLYIIYI